MEEISPAQELVDPHGSDIGQISEIARSASLDQLSQGLDLRFQGSDGPSPGEKETTATSTAQRVEIQDSGRNAFYFPKIIKQSLYSS